MPEELVLLDHDAESAVITLDSPRNRNALSVELGNQLLAHLEDAAADPDVRTVVLTHTGSVFSAGADLREATSIGMTDGTRRLLKILRTIVELPKPVIARIAGTARAGGVGIIGACDIAVCAPGATFAFTEVRIGLAPAIISLTTQHRLGDRATSRYYLTGEIFDAHEAQRIGLITDVAEDLDAVTATYVAKLHESSPQGLAQTKLLTTALTRQRLADEGERMVELSTRLFASEEAQEGMLAFREKRPPRWMI